MTGTLPRIVQGTACTDIPLHTFDINKKARYVKIVMETYYAYGSGLKYVHINFNWDVLLRSLTFSEVSRYETHGLLYDKQEWRMIHKQSFYANTNVKQMY